MKMVYVGSLSLFPDRDSGWIKAFSERGCEVIQFSSLPNLERNDLIGRVCNRFHIGHQFSKLQRDLLTLVEIHKPAWVHFRLPIEFSRKTIQSIGQMGAIVTEYFNDDPFSNKSPFGLHWKFRKALSSYDGHFVYRAHNITDYQKSGAKYVAHCPPTYDPRRHKLIDRNLNPHDFIADAAFLGHCEGDWRVDCLDALAREGFRVIIRGSYWDHAIRGRVLEKLLPITGIYGDEYNRIYAGVLAGLCFFSKINRDSWTERALEIIAVGGTLVCERTEEAQSYFRDREEAYFFSSIDELLDIVRELKSNPGRREEVRRNGYRRLISGKNTIDDRAQQILTFVDGFRKKGG